MFTGTMARGLGQFARIAAMIVLALLAGGNGRLMAEENIFGDESTGDKAGEAKDVEPISWNVKPMATTSPASQPATRPATTRIGLPSDIASIVYPSNSSAAIGLICTARLNPRIICMDPVANARLGEIKGNFASTRSRLPEVRISPDGLMVMNIDEEKDVLVVRCCNLNVLAKPTAIPSDSLAWFDFVKSEKVVLYRAESRRGSHDNASGELELWDIKTSRKLWSKSVAGLAYANTFAVSRDGRHLALLAGDDKEHQLQVYELAAGEMVGETVVVNPVKGNPYSSSRMLPEVMTFSPDGKELASVWGQESIYSQDGATSVLFVWDFATGRVKFAFPFSDRSPDNIRMGRSYDLGDIRKALNSTPIQWVNNVGWIVQGRLLVSREVQQVLYDFCDVANEKTLRFMRLLDNQNVLLGKTVAGTGILQETTISISTVQKALANAKAGGTLSDRKLPALTKADFSSMQTKQLASLVAWSVQWPGAPAAAPTTGPVKAASPRSFKLPGAVAESTDSNSFHWIDRPAQLPNTVFLHLTAYSGRNRDRETKLVWVDLATNLLNQMTMLPGRDYQHSLSPDGTRLAVFDGSRIDVFGTKEKKHLVGWKVRESTNPDSKRRARLSDIQGVRFISADLLLTLGNDQATLWQVPQCQAIYTLTGLTDIEHACFSLGNRYFITSDGKVVESASGELKGSLESPPTDERRSSSNMALSPDGQTLVRSVENEQGVTLVFHDMRTGRIKSSVPCGQMKRDTSRDNPTNLPNFSYQTLTTLSGGLAWGDPDYILINNSSLFSLKHKRVVWRVMAANYGGFYEPTPRYDALGQYWLPPAQGKELVFAPVSMMDASIRQKIEEEAAKLPPALISPGMKISIDYQVSPADKPEEFKKEVMASLTRTLQASGFEVVDSAGQLRLVVSTTSGESIQYGKSFYGMRASSVDFTVNALVCKATVQDAQGQVILENTSSCIPSGAQSTDNNPAGAIVTLQWSMAKSFFMSFRFNNLIYPKDVVGEGPLYNPGPKKDSTGTPTGTTPGGGVIKNPPRRIMPPRRS